MKRKVIIEALPKAKTGQQVGGSLYNTPALMGGLDRNKSNQTGKATRTIGAVPREQANLEAEGGETVVGDLTGIGIPQHFTISGPRHAQGGVPMDLPDNSFIFSDFNQMTIKDPTALKYFGKAMKKGGKVKGYTPAEIAKQYDNNKNIETLKNKNSDKLDRKTAELNLKNNNMKLGALALLQEAKKGFENGIPELSYPYLEKLGVNPEEMFGQQEQGLPQAKKEGAVKKLRRKQDGGMMPPPEMMQQQQMQNPMMGQAPQQDPMQEVMMMVQQMMEQGAAPEDVIMELLNNQVPPDVIVQVFVQMGMPQEQAVQIIQAVMSQEQGMPEQGMDPSMMEGQGMTPDMMPAMDPGMAMMQMGGASNPNDSLTQEIMSALDQGASPEEVIEFLIQQGIPEQEASQMVIELVQRSSVQTQPSMYRGGELPKAQVGEKVKGKTGEVDASKVGKLPGKGQSATTISGKKAEIIYEPGAERKPARQAVSGSKTGKPSSGWEDAICDMIKKGATYQQLTVPSKENNFKTHMAEGPTSKAIFDKCFTKDVEEKFKEKETAVYIDDEEKPADPDKKNDAERPEITDPDIQGVRSPDVAEWTAPDIYNFRGAIQDRLGIKSYYPWAARFNPQFMDPTFYDPSRELAAQGEQANIVTQGLGQFSGPQALSARAAQIQGQGAKQAADTLGRYNNLNVGLQNQFAGQNAQIANQAQQYNQAKAQDLYDKGVITQQQRDNSIRQANQQIRQGFAQGWKNASDIAMINANQEQYKVDPYTGTVFHTGVDRPMDPKKAAANFEERVRAYQRMGLDGASAVAAAKAESRTNTATFAKGGYVLGANTFPFMFY